MNSFFLYSVKKNLFFLTHSYLFTFFLFTLLSTLFLHAIFYALMHHFILKIRPNYLHVSHTEDPQETLLFSLVHHRRALVVQECCLECSRPGNAVKSLLTGQLFLMDRFLDGTFFTFGIEVISFAMRDEEDRVDPVIYIFPRMTKCTFHKFGSSGNIESHDALCILPINIVNEKIYVFLWFWFLVLGTLTLLVVLYRLVIILSPRMRAYLLFVRFRLIKKECINVIIKKTQMGDWFLLYMLGQNVDNMIFKELIHELARRLGYSSKDLIDF